VGLEALGVAGFNAEDERVLAPELTAGERLLWAGHPRRGVRFTAADLFLVPFSLLWCGFALFWEKAALDSDAPLLFKLWGLPFVAIGLYLVFGRFVVDTARRKKTTYGLTPRRLILVSGLFARQVKSIELPSLGEISLTERTDKSGTVTLGTPTGLNARSASLMGPSWPGASRYLPPMLEAIEDARAVYEKIRATRNQTGR
jgi:hypothetical protein